MTRTSKNKQLVANSKTVYWRQYWNKEIYRLWLVYLKAADYKSEPIASIYAEWGDLDMVDPNDAKSFNKWWAKHWKKLFAEKVEQPLQVREIHAPDDMRHCGNPDVMYLEIPLDKSRKQLLNAFKTKIKGRSAGTSAAQYYRQHSKAKFRIESPKPQLDTIKLALEVYKLRQEKVLFKTLIKEIKELTPRYSQKEGVTLDENAIRRAQSLDQKAREIMAQIKVGKFI